MLWSPDKIVVNFAGISGSGKSTMCKAAASELGGFRYRPADIIEAHARAIGKTLTTRQDYRQCTIDLRHTDPLALVRPILTAPKRIVCTDSLRCVRDITALIEDHHIPVCTVALWTNWEKSYERVSADEQRAASRYIPPSFEAFTEEQLAEWEGDNPDLPNIKRTMNLGAAVCSINVDPFHLDDASPSRAITIAYGIEVARNLIARVEAQT